MTYKDYDNLRDDVIDMIHLREKINSKLKEFNIDAELPSGCNSISDVLGDIDAHFDEQEKNQGFIHDL